MAAVLAVGADAVLSHASAAALWELTPTLNPPAFNAVVEVTFPGGGKRKRAGIRIHRSTTLTKAHTTLRRNIPVTTPTRTLEDLRPRLPLPQFHAALRQAEIRGYDVSKVAAPGAPTRSDLERAFLRLCRRHRLPEPEVNESVGRYQADFLWRRARLIAEADSYAFHRGRGAFELDRRREAELAAAGYEILRFTWRQVTEDPTAVVAALRARLLTRSR
jgi:very-short-patch-repair endonuclease